ncbi:MAG: hypothetical protein IIT58_09225 [Treponema sp.]|nr:hypothetical protein [Treponema sp.]
MKKLLSFAVILLAGLNAFSQELTARQIADNAVAKAKPDDAIKYVQTEVQKLTVPSEKRATWAFLGSLQESVSLYSDAVKSYSAAVAISATNAEGMPKKSSERLVLDAVRCALSVGEYETAESFLNSAVRNSKNTEIQATIKLYEQWCALSKAEKYEDTMEALAMLKAYLEFPSMESVKPNILLTLWYITGEKSYADSLVKAYPRSAEAGIASGKVQIYPAPFWYFVPRKNSN